MCSLKYSVNLLLLVEFGDLPSTWPTDFPASHYYEAVYGCSNVTDHVCTSPQIPDSDALALYPKSEVEFSALPAYLGILAGLFVGFRVLSLFFLRVRSNN